jgi:hypothetical protein
VVPRCPRTYALPRCAPDVGSAPPGVRALIRGGASRTEDRLRDPDRSASRAAPWRSRGALRLGRPISLQALSMRAKGLARGRSLQASALERRIDFVEMVKLLNGLRTFLQALGVGRPIDGGLQPIASRVGYRGARPCPALLASMVEVGVVEADLDPRKVCLPWPALRDGAGKNRGFRGSFCLRNTHLASDMFRLEGKGGSHND